MSFPFSMAKEGSAFCTGHTSMVGPEMASYTEALNAQFREEYKLAHGISHPKGPGRAETVDWEPIIAGDRRPEVAQVPISGKVPVANNLHYIGQSTGYRSSSAIGSFWNDPVFSQFAHSDVEPVQSTARKGHQKQTSSEVGRFWENKEAEIMETVTEFNRAGSLLESEACSSFNLEALPTQHRIL